MGATLEKVCVLRCASLWSETPSGFEVAAVSTTSCSFKLHVQ